MSQAYLSGGDSFIEVINNIWAGQTFRVQETHLLEWIDLDISIPAFIPEPVVLIFHADISHEPFGEYISRNKWMEYPYWNTGIRKRVRFPMTSVILSPDFYYCIILEYYPSILGGKVKWFYDADDATYPRGLRISSDDFGATWTKHYNDDHMFAEFGTPPSPPPPPSPPIGNWLITTFAYSKTETGFTIVVGTNVPCHLFMYWTNIPPGKNKESIMKRGLPTTDLLRYCFVAWHENEQLEPGDTLYHTFVKPNWPVCETRYFVFRGYIFGNLSPSVSPIFFLHRSEVKYCLIIKEEWTT